MDVNDMCDSLNKALNLEVEGKDFYTKCAEKTSSAEGRRMFDYLAKEEEAHYNKVLRIFETDFKEAYAERMKKCEPNMKIKPSGVFKKKIAGGKISTKSDVLDALNISLKAEEDSIRLYEKLAKQSFQADTIRLFEQLVEEEKTHHSILENEVEFVTKTGEFTDFKTITL